MEGGGEGKGQSCPHPHLLPSAKLLGGSRSLIVCMCFANTPHRIMTRSYKQADKHSVHLSQSRECNRVCYVPWWWDRQCQRRTSTYIMALLSLYSFFFSDLARDRSVASACTIRGNIFVQRRRPLCAAGHRILSRKAPPSPRPTFEPSLVQRWTNTSNLSIGCTLEVARES